MSYYDHATMIAHRLGPWQQQPEPPFDIPARHHKLQAPTRICKKPDPQGAKPDSCAPQSHHPDRLRKLVLRIRTMLAGKRRPALTQAKHRDARPEVT